MVHCSTAYHRTERQRGSIGVYSSADVQLISGKHQAPHLRLIDLGRRFGASLLRPRRLFRGLHQYIYIYKSVHSDEYSNRRRYIFQTERWFRRFRHYNAYHTQGHTRRMKLLCALCCASNGSRSKRPNDDIQHYYNASMLSHLIRTQRSRSHLNSSPSDM